MSQVTKIKIQIKPKVSQSTSITGKLTHVDLFAGTGAFSLGLKNLVDTIYANDIFTPSKLIYDQNFALGGSNKLVLGDITLIDIKQIPKCDILTAGIICQPFSVAGKQKGFSDDRSVVYWKLFEILNINRPPIVIIENVKNLLHHDDGDSFNLIIQELEKLDYKVKYKLFNTADVTGIPQHRERVFIAGFQNNMLYQAFDLDLKQVPKRPLSDFLEVSIPSKYYYNDTSNIHTIVRNQVVKHDTVYQFRRTHVRENKSGECPTLTANMGTGGHNVPLILDNVGVRKLTPRECFNLQGFPSSYNLSGISDANLYKLAGNAITVTIIELIAQKLIKALSDLNQNKIQLTV